MLRESPQGMRIRYWSGSSVLPGLGKKGAPGPAVSRVPDPDLVGEEPFLPGDFALPHRLAGRPLVAAAGRCVDEPASGL